jgi:hypothetical protein
MDTKMGELQSQSGHTGGKKIENADTSVTLREYLQYCYVT